MSLKLSKSNKISIVLVSVVVLILVFFIGRWTSNKEYSQEIATVTRDHVDQVWTCSMHPEIRQDHPGNCPVCGMELIPMADGEAVFSSEVLEMSPTAVKLASVHTAQVRKEKVSKDIHLTGKVTLDPQYAFAQNTHISGRVEDLFVNNIGEYVEKGQRIALIYSPELYNAQKELLEAYKDKDISPRIYKAVREKFELWKIESQEIERILQKGEPRKYFPIYADHSGYVVQKNIDRGEYVQDGTDLFIISQLNRLWGVFNIYEKDVPFIRKGMSVEYELDALPGKIFHSKIHFVEPILNPETRTLSARILISNPDLRFKPEMFLEGTVHATRSQNEGQMIIPQSAVLWTGRESVVYVKHISEDQAGFEMRKVVLGPFLGDSYVVEKGLEPGEDIVVEGTFSVDAAAQLADKPSMMNEPHHHEQDVVLKR